MTTDKQREASRRNGAKSRGPVTPEGKRISSMNARRGNLLTRTMLTDDESRAHFEALLQQLMEEFQPLPGNETLLVESMAGWRWRKLRFAGLETEILSHEIRNHRRMTAGEPLSDIAHAAFAMRNLTDNSRLLDYLAAGQANCEVQYARCLRQLLKSIARRAKIFYPVGPGIPDLQPSNSLENHDPPGLQPENEPENEPETNPE